jgi:hypothetical protein
MRAWTLALGTCFGRFTIRGRVIGSVFCGEAWAQTLPTAMVDRSKEAERRNLIRVTLVRWLAFLKKVGGGNCPGETAKSGVLIQIRLCAYEKSIYFFISLSIVWFCLAKLQTS